MQKDKYLLLIRNKTLLLLILSFCSTTSNSQEKDSIIIWNKNYKLSWNDFSGKNYINKYNSSAISSLKLYYIQSYYKNKIHSYNVITLFYRYKSFSSSNSLNLLKHEQIHFDIHEIFARKIRKHFQLLKNQNSSEYTYNRIFTKYIDSLAIYQEKYDLDTDYSIIEKRQNFWNKIVAKKLQELDDYSIENLYKIKESN